MERRRLHEEQHAQAPGGLAEGANEQGGLTAGGVAIPNDQEEEKEVDPSIVGSLDNVYRDNPNSSISEDPFKKVPMMDDHEKPSSMMEMEKTVDAMVALVEHDAPGSPVPEDAPPTPDGEPRDLLCTPNFVSPELVGSGSAESMATPSIPLAGVPKGGKLLESEGAKSQAPTTTTQDLNKGMGGLSIASTTSS